MKKINHIWSILSQSSAVDKDTNSLSILNIIEELNGEAVLDNVANIKDYINIPAQLTLVSLYERNNLDKNDEIKSEVKIELFVEGENKPVMEIKHPLVIPSDKRRMRFRININGMKVKNQHRHIFKFKIKEGDKYTETFALPLFVNIKVKTKNKK